MRRGDIIKCQDLQELTKTTIELKEAGEHFDVLIHKDIDEYKILITRDHADE